MVQFLKKIGYGFLALIILALLLELVLGIVFWVKDMDTTVEDVTDYPYLYYQYNESEQTNQHGFKTNARLEKPEGVYRIILTGGSVARGKAPNESIAQYLQDTLRARLGTDKIEVINAGVSGYILQQEFILTQLVLRQYNPDMIIGLDGYNDALTLALNPNWETTTPFKPHSWEQFRVIKEGRWKRKPYSRFSYFFKHTNRAKESYLRGKRFTAINWQERLSNGSASSLAQAYRQTYTDINNLCQANGIKYYQFIQPVQAKEVDARFANGAGLFMLSFLNQVKQQTQADSFAISLQTLFNGQQELFYDDVHVLPKGNQIFAGAIANSVLTPFTVD